MPVMESSPVVMALDAVTAVRTELRRDGEPMLFLVADNNTRV